MIFIEQYYHRSLFILIAYFLIY